MQKQLGGEMLVFSINGAGTFGYLYAIAWLSSMSYRKHKNSLKVDQNLKVKPKTIKLLEENIGENLCELG